MKILRAACFVFLFLGTVVLFPTSAQAQLQKYQCGNFAEQLTCGSQVCLDTQYCEHYGLFQTGRRCATPPEGFCEYQEIKKQVMSPYKCGEMNTRYKCGIATDQSICPAGFECRAIDYTFGPYYCTPTAECQAAQAPTPIPSPTNTPAVAPPTATPTKTVTEACGNFEMTPNGRRCIINGVAATNYFTCANPWPGQECCTNQAICPVITQAPTATPPPDPTNTPAPTPLPPTPTMTPSGGSSGPSGGGGTLVDNVDDPILDPLEGPSNEDFDALNPLSGSAFQEQLSTPGGIISRVLAFAFPIGGVALFLMLIWAGFEILVNSADKNAVSAGKQRATAAIVGYILLFCAYWLMQIVEFVFGIHIL